MKIGIYKLTNLVNGRIYIGKSTDLESIENRIDLAIQRSNNPLLRADYELQNSDCFKFEIIEIVPETGLKNRFNQIIKGYPKNASLYNRKVLAKDNDYALYRRVEYKGQIYKNYNNLAWKLRTTSRKAYDLIRKGEAKFVD